MTAPATALWIDGVTGSRASTISAWTTPTGSIDIRVEAMSRDWADANSTLISKYDFGTNNRSWYLRHTSTGFLQFAWSEDGTSGTLISRTAAVPTAILGLRYTPKSRHWVRVTLDVTTGAVQFFVSSDGTAWTSLGTVAGSGVTSIFQSTAPLLLGAQTDGLAWNGSIYKVIIKDGIAGTDVVNLDMSTLTAPFGSTFSDSLTTSFTVEGDAAVAKATQYLELVSISGPDISKEWAVDPAVANANNETIDENVGPLGFVTFTPVVTGTVANPNFGSTATKIGKYRKIGPLVFVYYVFQFGGSGISAGSGYWEFAIPSAITPSTKLSASTNVGEGSVIGEGVIEDTEGGTSRTMVACYAEGGSTPKFRAAMDGRSTNTDRVLTDNFPTFARTSGDTITMTLVYALDEPLILIPL